jgi:hypothetical protein
MSAPKGKTPSLIGGSLGACSFVRTGSRGSLRNCKRCHTPFERDAVCVEITIPGSMGHKTFCRSCFGLILDVTQAKVDALRAQLKEVESGSRD